MNTAVFRLFILTAGIFAFAAPASAQVVIEPFPQGAPRPAAPAEEQPVYTPDNVQDTQIPENPESIGEPVDIQTITPPPAIPPQQAEGPLPEPTRPEFTAPEPASGEEPGSGQVHAYYLDQPVSRDWRASEGQNIRDILETWSQEAGVKFVWEGRNQFAVLQTLDKNTTYENAVRELLDQYQKNEVRPVGQLHVDPATGERTLVVDDGA